METFPRFGLDPLTTDEVNEVARRIAADTTINCPLPSTQNAGWSSKDLHIGKTRAMPALEEPPLSNRSNVQSSRKIQAEQFDTQVQSDALEFVGSDIRVELALDKPLRWIRIQGLGRTFYHFQLYAAFWLLMADRGARRGTILADMMGLGKTTTAYLYILLNSVLAAIATDRKCNPEQHLSGGSGTRCPSQFKWPVVCSCVTDGVTNRRGLYAIKGPSLILVPASLLSTWSMEWQSMKVVEPFPAKLYIHHHSLPGRAVPKAVHHHLRLVSQENERCELQSDTSHRYVVLTTVESYSDKVVRGFSNVNCTGEPKPARLIHFPDDHDGIGWARVVRDEAHLTINYDTQFFNIMQSFTLRAYQPPNFLPLTATPRLRNGIGDMMSLVRTINNLSPDLARDPVVGRFTSTEQLERLQQQQAMVRDMQLAGQEVKPADERTLADFTGQLDVTYTIRRRNSSVQNGKGLAILPPIVYMDVECVNTVEAEVLQMQRVEWLLKKQITHEFKEKKSKWELEHPGQPMEEIELDMFLDNAQLPRMLATIPGATDSGRNRQLFTWDNIEGNGWHKRPELSWFAQNLGQIERTSGKLSQLRKLVEVLGTDVQGLPEKLVVVSEFPVVCLAVLVFLQSMNISTKWMHAKLDTTEREALASEFQADRVDDEKTVPCRVLVGSTKILGQGITLNRAFRLVLMEPNRHVAVEQQIFKRIHRIGSNTDRCWVYRLINPASRIEAMLVKDQLNQLRNEFLAQGVTETGAPSNLDDVDWVMKADEQGESDKQAELAM